MKNKLSRRSFIKGGAAIAGSALVASVPVTAKADSKTRLATLHDLSKCIGCGECVEACKEVNDHKFANPEKPFPKMYPKRVPVQDWSDKKDVSDRLTPYNWLYIQETEVTTKDGNKTVYIPRRCMHCVNPPCVKLCPWGAASQKENGLSKIDPDICLGGSKCNKVCPWHIPQRQTGTGLYLDILPSLAGNGVMYKCDRCYDRLEKSEQPACIEICPEDVQTIGPRDEIIKQAYKLAEETNGYVYGDKENGGTNTIYVSPVPFDQLNAAIEKGKGKPDLTPKKDKMALGNNIAMAMIIAPFAGIFASIGKMISMNKKNKEQEATNEK